MAAYDELLSDLNAERIYLWEITYKVVGGATSVLRLSTQAYSTPPTESVQARFRETILTDFINTDAALDDNDIYGGFVASDAGTLEWDNTDGAYDAWQTGISVDQLSVRCLLVGRLKDGRRVDYDVASASPVFVGSGVGRPKVNPIKVTIGIQSALAVFGKVMNPHLFSPPCPSFPRTSSGYVDFGNVLDRTGSFTEEFWVYCLDPSLTGQIVISKDTGTAGRFVDIGTAGSGALRWSIREQTPPTSDTPAATIKPLTWHEVAVQWDSGTKRRLIYVDRVLVTTTNVSSGNPVANAAAFRVGANFGGLISGIRPWGVLRTLAQVDANMLTPLAGTETGLDAMLLMDQGTGATTADRKAGSSIVGTLGPGVTWSTSGWCGSSLVGQRWPVVIGKALDVQLVGIDPSRDIFAAAYGPAVAIPVVRSNHDALTVTTQYSADLTRGLITLTAAAGGTLSADVVGETAWNSAILFDGSTGFGSGTVAGPSGSMSVAAMVSITSQVTATSRVAGWTASSGVGQRTLSVGVAGANLPRFSVRNDAGTAFTCDGMALVVGHRCMLVGVLDVAALQIRLYQDGALTGTTAITGTFLTTVTAFTVGRNSTASTEFLGATVDEVTVWSRALAQGDADSLSVLPSLGTETGLASGWHLDENTGTSCGNMVSGGPPLTLSGGATWTYGRIAPCDILTTTALRYAGWTRAQFDITVLAIWVRQIVADCGVLVTDESTCQDVLHTFLKGLTSFGRLTGSLLQVRQIALPTGTPDANADFGGSDTFWDEIDDGNANIQSEYYGVDLQYAENHNVMDATQIAGIVQSDPARYQFAQSQWRIAPARDNSILADFPNATVLSLPCPLINEADARAEATRVFPFYRPERLRRVLPFRCSALVAQAGGEVRVTYQTNDVPSRARLGMGSPGMSFRVVGATRAGNKVTVRGLA